MGGLCPHGGGEQWHLVLGAEHPMPYLLAPHTLKPL